ncbi:MAG: VOC family protein [Gammaproteobacteria bacterium]
MTDRTIEPRPRFHLAIPVRDLQAARDFYGELLGCSEGRSSDTWVDFDLGGHQLVCHLVEQMPSPPARNPVDGDPVPIPHFGLVLTLTEWEELAGRLESAGVAFEITPHVRFRGQPGEQGTFFLFDPSGNALEFKGLADLDRLFAR